MHRDIHVVIDERPGFNVFSRFIAACIYITVDVISAVLVRIFKVSLHRNTMPQIKMMPPTQLLYTDMANMHSGSNP